MAGVGVCVYKTKQHQHDLVPLILDGWQLLFAGGGDEKQGTIPTPLTPTTQKMTTAVSTVFVFDLVRDDWGRDERNSSFLLAQTHVQPHLEPTVVGKPKRPHKTQNTHTPLAFFASFSL